jgi:hypothetical protein
MSSQLTTLFQGWAEREPETIIQLLNKDKVPVAALYLNKLKYDNLVITMTKHLSEKYYIYFDGIAIFFTYYRKGEPRKHEYEQEM